MSFQGLSLGGHRLVLLLGRGCFVFSVVHKTVMGTPPAPAQVPLGASPRDLGLREARVRDRTRECQGMGIGGGREGPGC